MQTNLSMNDDTVEVPPRDMPGPSPSAIRQMFRSYGAIRKAITGEGLSDVLPTMTALGTLPTALSALTRWQRIQLYTFILQKPSVTPNVDSVWREADGRMKALALAEAGYWKRVAQGQRWEALQQDDLAECERIEAHAAISDSEAAIFEQLADGKGWV